MARMVLAATLGGLQFFPGAESVAGNTLTQSGRGSVTFGQKPFLNSHANAAPSGSFDARGLSRNRYQAHAVSAQTLDLEARPQTKGQRFHVPDFLPVRGPPLSLPGGCLVTACSGVTWTELNSVDVLSYLRSVEIIIWQGRSSTGACSSMPSHPVRDHRLDVMFLLLPFFTCCV